MRIGRASSSHDALRRVFLLGEKLGVMGLVVASAVLNFNLFFRWHCACPLKLGLSRGISTRVIDSVFVFLAGQDVLDVLEHFHARGLAWRSLPFEAAIAATVKGVRL